MRIVFVRMVCAYCTLCDHLTHTFVPSPVNCEHACLCACALHTHTKTTHTSDQPDMPHNVALHTMFTHTHSHTHTHTHTYTHTHTHTRTHAHIHTHSHTHTHIHTSTPLSTVRQPLSASPLVVLLNLHFYSQAKTN